VGDADTFYGDLRVTIHAYPFILDTYRIHRRQAQGFLMTMDGIPILNRTSIMVMDEIAFHGFVNKQSRGGGPIHPAGQYMVDIDFVHVKGDDRPTSLGGKVVLTPLG